MSKSLKILFSILFLIILLIAGIFLSELSKQDQSAQDSGALYGGSIEKGYPYAGYLIAETRNGSKSCGYAVLTPTIAITASHCVDDAESILLGLGNFNYDKVNKVIVNTAVQKSGWVNNKNRREDFAILRINEVPGFFTSFAEIGSVYEGCNFRVVAYGRTEDPSEYGRFPRKSAKLCAYSIENEIFRVVADKSEQAGICFGDSGSPVFEEGTNKVVGVIASIVKNPNKSADQQCDFGNTAIVVRTDNNLKLVNQNIQIASFEAVNVNLNTDINVEIVDTTTANNPLGFLDNLSNEQKIMAGGLIFLGTLFIFFAVKALFRRDY